MFCDAPISFDIKGEDLVGIEYEPLFPFFINSKNAFVVLSGDFVTTEDGTGVVHIAPDFGEEDYNLAKKHKIDILSNISDDGSFLIEDEITYFLGEREQKLSLSGKNVLTCDDEIIKYLKSNHLWFFTEDHIHQYPHCWRTDVPLIYRAISSWYLNVQDIKDRMIELNQDINWIPSHIKDGQYGNWIKNVQPWCISRNRYWGLPLPVWKSENPKNKNLYVFGSIKELEDFFECKIEDLHKEHLDQLTKEDPLDANFLIKRVPEVMDCWFESGAMPFASIHYPFENQDLFKKTFPGDFVVEYLAQTRGWFYTMFVLSVALFDSIPFKNCICHGVVVDQNGTKLSKRLRNYPDPFEIFDKYGSDAMRWAFIKSGLSNGEDLRIDIKGEIFLNAFQKVIQPLDSALNFYCSYIKIDKVEVKNRSIGELIENDFFIKEKKNLFDIYMLDVLKKFAKEFVQNMDNYELPKTAALVEDFIENLNNWYIRRNKDRFWQSEKDSSKIQAYQTLRDVIYAFATFSAPLLPFTSEAINLSINNQ